MSGATRALPTGEVTFAFTDIEGSTNLLRALGDERYDAVLREHLDVVAAAIDSIGGALVHTEGDSCFAAFASADDAIAACVAAQAGLHAHRWPDGVEVRVRIGVHSGLAQPRGHDYSALAVHQAARVMSAASGGQILVSGVTAALLRDPDSTGLRPLGRYQVRDFDEPIAIYEVHDARWPAADRPPRAVPADGHNIARPASPLLGRARELAAIGDMITPGGLVSIVGPGGVGKTRLAAEIGRAQASRWPDGVWLVGLDTLTDPSQVSGAVIRAAHGHAATAADSHAAVVESLGTKSTLLILDNCEHLLDECAELASALLASSSAVGIVTTSRTPLGLTAERVWRLDALRTESDGSQLAPAVQLFLDRAESGGLLADAARADLDAVADLCRRLDGIPLAIELAAATAHRRSVSALIDAIRWASDESRARDRSAPPRHRSLDDLISWGYELLTPRDRLVARRVSVLPASFDVATAGAAAGLGLADVEGALESLVDSSLLGVSADNGGIRYRLLATVRAVLTARLDPAEHTEVVGRVVDHFTSTLGPTVPRDRTWTNAVAADLDNLRAVVDRRHPAIVESQQALAWAIGRYLDSTDQFALALAEIGHMLEVLDDASPARVALHCVLADCRLRVGDVVGATEQVELAALDLAEVGAPQWDDVCVARTRGDIALRSGDPELALSTVEVALARSPSALGAARLWNLAGLAHTTIGNLTEAASAFERELEAWSSVGDSGRAATAESNLAEVLIRRGDLVGAASHQLRCLDHAVTFGLPVPCAFSMIVAARSLAVRAHSGGGLDLQDAVELQGVADRLLAENHFVLYDTDLDERTEMISLVSAELGAERVAELLRLADAIDLGSAISTTATVLRQLIDEGAGHA